MSGSSRIALVALAGVVAAAAAAGLALYVGRPPEPDPAPPAAAESRPALYCEFFVFVESRPFLAFMLERSPGDPALYIQAYLAKADGDRNDYDALLGRRPEWRLDRAAEPPRLEARVTVPDSSQAGFHEQEIAIELRDFDPDRAGEAWTEASLKSAYYQNLPGKCRRAVIRDAGQRAGG